MSFFEREKDWLEHGGYVSEQAAGQLPPHMAYEMALQRIGVCEDCGWFFPVSPYETEEHAKCPKSDCIAGVMICDRAPTPPEPAKYEEPVNTLEAVWGEVYEDQLRSMLRQKPLDVKSILEGDLDATP